MAVRRITCNVETVDPALAQGFYGDILGLEPAMDLGWIVTFAGPEQAARPQVSFAAQGGSDMPVPDLSIEVDDLADVQSRLGRASVQILYGPVKEPWGVERLMVQDPFGKLVNIMQHLE